MPLPPRGASEKTQLAVAAENRRKEDLEREDFYDKLFELEQMSKNKKGAPNDESPSAPSGKQ